MANPLIISSTSNGGSRATGLQAVLLMQAAYLQLGSALCMR
ncbi:protein of unknown function [Xenorhabdus poinarii G6]|uniref:Uncharacterized protein n=1 Tax=Xenorhabdus poinarii G6 TaxID=1354304 RepID=A0A068R316_9GAMM|nr:protein of unknown function [Xenorhabdus poinarii G6]